jgi:hypothetical protein
VENIIPIENIQSKIFMIRGERVMLDRDLASLYGVEIKRLSEQVKRNLDKFPSDFMFSLSKTEEVILRSQNATAKNVKDRYVSKVFTEHGILMLSSVLNSNIATSVSIQIMRTFVEMRKFISSNINIQTKLSEIEAKYSQHDKEIAVIFEAIKQLMEPVVEEQKYKIGFLS